MVALAAGTATTALFAAATGVYLAVDGLGAALLVILVLGAAGFALSGWLAHWRLSARLAAAAAEADAVPAAGGDSPALRLIEGVAGEFKSSLAAMSGFSELLASGQPEGPEFRQSCAYLLENSRQLSAFAAQLHDFARFERGRLRLLEQQVDAADLVEAALGDCREQPAAAEAVIVADLPEGVEIRCDAQRIRQGVASLVQWLVHALSETAPGPAMIEVRIERLDDGGLAILASGPAAASVEETPNRLFEPHLAQNGLNGLALPIARRVALLHAGDVAVESGAATAVRLTLPPARVTWPGAAADSEVRAA